MPIMLRPRPKPNGWPPSRPAPKPSDWPGFRPRPNALPQRLAPPSEPLQRKRRPSASPKSDAVRLPNRRPRLRRKSSAPKRRGGRPKRIAFERLAAERLAAERKAAEAQAEAERRLAAQAEAERRAIALLEAERVAAAQAEAQRAAAARAEADRLAAAAAQALRAPVVPTQPPALPERPATASTQRAKQTLVLVADDSKVVRIKTGRLLAQHQYQVAYATDGLDAVQQLQATAPDVVITDVEMPGMDGFELTRHIRGNPQTRAAAGDHDHRRRRPPPRAGRAAGVSVLLGKPYPEDALIAHIRLAMGQDAGAAEQAVGATGNSAHGALDALA